MSTTERDGAAPAGPVVAGLGRRFNPGPPLGIVLRYGSRLSIAVLALGVALALARGEKEGSGLRPDAMATALWHGHGAGVVGVGIAILIATPICRDVTALALFVRHKERALAIMTGVVLLLVALTLVFSTVS
jgi:uncharacterized membrane protein